MADQDIKIIKNIAHPLSSYNKCMFHYMNKQEIIFSDFYQKSYDLVFHFNIDLRIFEKLGMVTIIIIFFIFKGLNLIPLDELYKSSLDKHLVSRSNISFL
jgi:hypothetical protein